MKVKPFMLAAVLLIIAVCPVLISDDSEAADMVVNDDNLAIYYKKITEPTGSAHGTVRTVDNGAPYTGPVKPLNIPKTVSILGKEYDVVEIGEGSFKNWDIDYISIPSTVTKIGANAFSYCYQVKEIRLNSTPEIGNNAFSLGYEAHPAECSIYGFTPTRPVGESGNPYEDIFGKYTTVNYKDISPNSRDALIHIGLIALGIAALLFMGRSVKVKKIKRKKKR